MPLALVPQDCASIPPGCRVYPMRGVWIVCPCPFGGPDGVPGVLYTGSNDTAGPLPRLVPW
jgi:hypothetical protein